MDEELRKKEQTKETQGLKIIFNINRPSRCLINVSSCTLSIL
jgi:hypothetical protein